jgi:hypothetical protein
MKIKIIYNKNKKWKKNEKKVPLSFLKIILIITYLLKICGMTILHVFLILKLILFIFTIFYHHSIWLFVFFLSSSTYFKMKINFPNRFS